MVPQNELNAGWTPTTLMPGTAFSNPNNGIYMISYSIDVSFEAAAGAEGLNGAAIVNAATSATSTGPYTEIVGSSSQQVTTVAAGDPLLVHVQLTKTFLLLYTGGTYLIFR